MFSPAFVAVLLLQLLQLFFVRAAEDDDWQSAVVVDVGSTGSRVHVLRWRAQPRASACPGGVEVQLPPTSWKHTPGFATLLLVEQAETTETTMEATVHEYFSAVKLGLDALLPQPRFGTPLWIEGTGGMRELPKPLQQQVLRLVEREVASNWPEYATLDEHAVAVLPGNLEAIYAWLALVQIIDATSGDGGVGGSPVTLRSKPLGQIARRPAMVELGGASTQVVLEAPHQAELLGDGHGTRSAPVRRLAKEGFSALGFCGTEHAVFARSLQGYGRQLSLQRFLCEAGKNLEKRLPCLPGDLLFPRLSDCDRLGTRENIAVFDVDATVDGIRGATDSTFDECTLAVQRTLFEAEDLRIPFAVAEDTEIIATESFYYLYTMVLDPFNEMKSKVTVADFRRRAKELCALGSSRLVQPLLHRNAEFEKVASACFGLTFAAALLERLLGLPPDRQLSTVNDVAGVELGWPLGLALLHLPTIVEPPTARPQPHDEL